MPTLNFANTQLRQGAEGAPRAPTNCIIYAVGDIHGRLDLLAGVTSELRQVASVLPAPERLSVIFLGDYIDRGPDACGVISHLIEFAAEGVCETVFLRGNHEQILLDVVDTDADPMMWLDYGGVETLRSYGVDQPVPVTGKDARTVAARVRAALPPEHLTFLRSTELYADRGDYLFVHAGLRPDRLLHEQTVVDLLWYRFFDDRQPVHGKVVVHGHTPRKRPVVGRWRIDIDTKAYESGILTALRCQGADRQFLNFQLATDGAPSHASPWETTSQPQPAQTSRAVQRRERRRAAAAGRKTGSVVVLSTVVAGVALLAMILGIAWLWARRNDLLPPPRPDPADAASQLIAPTGPSQSQNA